jgi:hypothetical protein
MFYQSCRSTGDRYEEYAVQLMTDDDEINLADYEYYQYEEYYLDPQIEQAIEQAERYEMNDSSSKEAGQVEPGLWVGAERIVL